MDEEIVVRQPDIALLLGVSGEAARGYLTSGKLRGQKVSWGIRQVWAASLTDVLAFATEHRISVNARHLERIRSEARHGKENG